MNKNDLKNIISNLNKDFDDLSGYYFACTDDYENYSCGKFIVGCSQILESLELYIQDYLRLDGIKHSQIFEYLHETKGLKDYSHDISYITSIEVTFEYRVASFDTENIDFEDIYMTIENIFDSLEQIEW